MADLNLRERETLMNLIFQRGVDFTALTLDQLREFPKSSLENPNWAHKSGPRSFVAISYGVLEEYEGHWAQDEFTGDEGFSTTMRTSSGCVTKAVRLDEEILPGTMPQERRKVQRKSEERQAERGKGSCARRFFRPYRKGGSKGKKFGKADSSPASKTNIAKEEVEEEEAEDDALLTDKKKNVDREEGQITASERSRPRSGRR